MRLRASKKELQGFTLVEILVVVAIISLLAAMVLVGLNRSRWQGDDARRLEDLQQMRFALESYYLDHSQYPTLPGDNQTYFDSRDSNSWNTFGSFLVPKYISQMPIDPTNGESEGDMYPTANDAEYHYHGYAQSYILSTYVGSDPSWENGVNVYGHFYAMLGGTCTTIVDFQDCAPSY